MSNFLMLFSIHKETAQKISNFWIRKFNNMKEDLIPLLYFHDFIDFLLFLSIFLCNGKNVELLEVSLKETLKVIRSQAMNAFIHQGHCLPLPTNPLTSARSPKGLHFNLVGAGHISKILSSLKYPWSAALSHKRHSISG